MKKTLALKVIFLICFCYLGFQILVLPALLKRQAADEEKLEHSKSYKTIYYQFRDLYTLLNIPLFLLELDLITVSHGNIHPVLNQRRYLQYGLLRDTTPVTFEKFRLHFETIGLKFFMSKFYSRQHMGSVPSHFFLCGENLTVHVVMFYNKTQSTVYHEAVEWRDDLNSSCNINSEQFVKYPGIFDRFSVEKKGDLLIPSNPSKFTKEVQDSRFVKCNLTQAHEFLAKHPPDSEPEAQKFQRKARQIIARAKQYLDDLEIPFWLSSGTCLGWFRQCDIITYSKDVDFGIWIKNYKSEIVPAFEQGGFFLKHVFGKVSDSYELSFQAGDIKLDLFFFYEEEDHMWNGGTHHETGQKYKYTFPKFTMCWTIFLELKVRVPCPPEPYLEANYGKNWMEPVREWEWNKSPPNVRENGFWPKEEWEQVIQVY